MDRPRGFSRSPSSGDGSLPSDGRTHSPPLSRSSALVTTGLLLLASLSGPLGAAGLPPRAPGVMGPSSHLILPTSANGNGQFGSAFKTRVSIFNSSIYDYSIRAGLRVQSGEVSVQYIFIQAGHTLTFNNFLANVFAFTGGGAIDLDGGNIDNVFLVTAQVYVDTAAGRYSTSVQAADDLSAISPVRSGLVVGVSVNASFRTNVGCASITSTPQTVTFSVFNSSSRLMAPPFTMRLAGLGWDQAILSMPFTNGGIQIETTGDAVCYAVEVNNVSNDGSYQLAAAF